MRHELIALDAPDRWRAALKGLRHSFFHTWESCHATWLASGSPTFLYLFESQDARIVCPIVLRSNRDEVDIATPYGFPGFVGSGECSSFATEWRRFAKDKGWVCGYIGLNPILVRETYYSSDALYRQAETYVFNLEEPDDVLFSRFSQNRKRQIRSWQNHVSHEIARDELVQFVIHESPAFYGSREAWNPVLPATWEGLLSAPNVDLLGVKKDNVITAVSAFAWACDIGEYLITISVPEGKAASAALIWEGARLLRSQGAKVLNLGGPTRPEHGAADGVSEFKKRFGATAVARHSLKEVYDCERFERLCALSNVDPSDRLGFFPPYRSG